ncbi:hypothetical protein, partial [Butyrivibrio sp.]|uniref:hypothetical protein n=1 Tax=Butyrivibrio sp. TaxID=28121 RepID=UPI0025C2F468
AKAQFPIKEQRMSLATFSRRARLHLCNIYLSRECASLAERFLYHRKALSYDIKIMAVKENPFSQPLFIL